MPQSRSFALLNNAFCVEGAELNSGYKLSASDNFYSEWKFRALGAILALLIMLGGCLEIFRLHDKAIATAQDSMRTRGALMAGKAEGHFLAIDQVLRTVQHIVRERGAATDADLDAALGGGGLHPLMGELAAGVPFVQSVAVFDSGGALVSLTPAAGDAPPSAAGRDDFAFLRDHPAQGILLSPDSVAGERDRLRFSRRLDGAQGQFLGVAVAVIGTGELLAVDRSAAPFTHSRAGLARTDGLRLGGSGGPDPADADQPWRRLLGQGGGMAITRGTAGGPDVILVVQPLSGFPVVLHTSLPLSDVRSEWWSQSEYTAFGFAMLATVSFALCWAVGRHIREQGEHSAALHRVAAALRESERRLDRAQEIAGIGSWEFDIASRQMSWSRHLYRQYGLPEQAAPSCEAVLERIAPEDRAAHLAWHVALQAGEDLPPLQFRVIGPDGKEQILRTEGRAVRGPDGAIVQVIGTTQDVTGQRMIEQQLTQAQKLEAIGTLTGGMAHDFNNVLGIIIGNLDLLQPLIEGDPAAAELCNEALDGAERCAELVRRLLAFARRQSLRPERTEINVMVHDVVHLLSRTLGEDIDVQLDLDPALWPVMVDPSQLEAALVNLAANARDAMPRGGQLDIVTHNVELNATAAKRIDLPPGPYVCVEVADTGVGMPPDVAARIFEPFFTTKAPGKGSGLGLSMVLGFVKQSGGHVSLHSELGFGSTFRIYLPRCDEPAQAITPAAPRDAVAGGHETVLVLEDNAPLRRATMRQLAASGYRVLAADRADGALQVLDGSEQVDLLLTDVVMPGPMDGIDLAREALRRHPGLRVLIMSGYVGGPDVDQRMASQRFPLLAKPFMRDQLSRAVRGVLDMSQALPS